MARSIGARGVTHLPARAAELCESALCAREEARARARAAREETRALRARARAVCAVSVTLRHRFHPNLFLAQIIIAERRGMRAIAGGADAEDQVPPACARVVLIVDDHADTREMYTQFLRAMGFDTLEATTCAEALAKARSGEVAAVVLDRRLPDGDGVEVCRGLKTDARTRHLPVIVLSGRQQDGASGADVYLVKPVVPDVLCGELERLLASGRDGASAARC